MFDRAIKGWTLFKETFGILRREKSLMAFPVLSGVCILIALVFLFFPVLFVFRSEGFNPDSMTTTGWITWVAVLFVIYLVIAFISSFFKAGIVSNATAVIDGNDPALMDGIKASAANAGRIFVWSLIAATVGLVLRLLRNQKSGAGQVIGDIVSLIAGAAWELATFFVIPVMIFEHKNAFSAIKESGSLFRQTWGETVVAGFSFAFVYIPFMLFLAGTFFSLATENTTVIASMGALTIIIFAITAILISALQAILVALMYNYAKTGEISSKVDKNLITNSFTEKHTVQNKGFNYTGGNI
ncbi:putative membrane protein [Methanomicrobium sp. W14]|uniref:DUF6159 family protein n=1 Tax=Methanomicrobium sp. W14 TaxID=2817839 RepID=UPI001AE4F985|nr:DUF6159 family protein [Methanomicrobium sp. W14]MBP2132508.1 putative membrane protein [Methanomicrobium sp. W14]